MLDVISTEQIQEFLKQRKEQLLESGEFLLLLEEDIILHVWSDPDYFHFIDISAEFFSYTYNLEEKYKLVIKPDTVYFSLCESVNKIFIDECLNSASCLAETEQEVTMAFGNSLIQQELKNRGAL